MTDIAVVLIIVLVLVLIWRGPKTLPLLGQALGRGVKEARKEAGDLRPDPSATPDGDEPEAPTDPTT